MITGDEILSVLSERIIVKNVNGDLVYSNKVDSESFEKNILSKGIFNYNLSNGEIYTKKVTEKITSDGQKYFIYIYDKCDPNDYLTGVLIRGNFELALNEITKTCNDFLIIMCDIDDFKSFNDKYGHKVGDIVLKSVSNIIKKNINIKDIIGRYGGEEFIICLFNSTIDDAYNLSETIRKEIEKNPIYIEGECINITMTFGISTNVGNYDNKVYEADMSLIKGKQTGKNKTVIYNKKNQN